MEDFNMNEEPLLSWIAPQSHEQASWIYSYIYKKNILTTLIGINGTESIEDIIYLLGINMGNAECREAIKAMRDAWHQKKYRERNGRQVSFQLPNDIIRDLDRMAKGKSQSRTQMLRQIINNAAKQEKIESKKQDNRIEKLENNLKKLRKEKQEAEGVRNGIIKKLSEFLAEEVMHKCCYESTVGSMSTREIEESKDTKHQELVKKRIEEIESKIPDMKHFRTSFPKIRSYLSFSKND